MAWAWRVVKRCPGRSALRTLIDGPGSSPQTPAQRQREGERVGLLAVEPVQLQTRPRGVVEHLRAGAAQLVVIAAGYGDKPAQPDLAVAGGELGLTACRGVTGLTLAGGLAL